MPEFARAAAGAANVSWADLNRLFFSLPMPLRGVTIVGFLFLINVFSGIGNIWFHWPAAPILLVIALYLAARRRRTPEQRQSAEVEGA